MNTIDKLNNTLGYLTAMSFDRPELSNDLVEPLNTLSEAISEVENLSLSGVGSSNDKKDQIINKECIIVGSKDGLWDVYDKNGCLGTGLNNEEVNRVTRK